MGFVVNPIAGMGGSVGLKGTDGAAEKARELGARPVAPGQFDGFIESLTCVKHVDIMTCDGNMGADYFPEGASIVYEPDCPTTAADTIAAVEKFISKGAGLIVFCGGDGTARDIASVCGETPVLGIPGGVKMYSSVFATGPGNAARLVCDFVNGTAGLATAEIIDVDEDRFRAGELDFKLFGTVRMPFEERFVQRAKSPSSASDVEYADAVAKHLVEDMRGDDGVLFILCPGLIKSRLMKILALSDTRLGIDAVVDERLVGADLNEAGILELLARYPDARIVVTPIGSQGFIFGRGNQQVSAEVIASVGIGNINIVATPHKLAVTPRLFVHTGDPSLDERMAGFRKILNGYHNFEMRKIEAA